MNGKKRSDFKVLFISPPLSISKQAGGLKDIANVLPTMGVGYIAALLEKNGIKVKIMDCIGEPKTLDEIIGRIGRESPDVIGITATILTINTANDMAGEIKKSFPGVPLVIGGPQLCSAPEKTMREGPYDIGVLGEGEETMLELVNAMMAGRTDYSDIKGLALRKDGAVAFTKERLYIDDLDSLPFPARHLYPSLDRYRPVPASYIKKPVGLMISSRGCPYQCIFCDRKVFGNRFRAHSPKYVVDEMEHVIRVHGAKEIRFMDDTFTLDIGRVEGICDEILKRKMKVPWTCLTRVNTVNLDILRKMKRAGCWQVIYGIESGDQRMLNIIRKGVTVEQNENGIRLAKKAGLNVRATFVFGLPGETLETIKRTVEFAKRMRLDVVNFFTVILFPGNELYLMAKKAGKILHEDYNEYTSLIDAEETKLHYIPDGMTEKELKNAIVGAYRSYYFRPAYIMRQLLSIRGAEDISRYFTAFRSIVSMRKAS
ncbi:MAG: cobalamin-dependent protein [Candidatus Omnitrophica bacterium]|nr:cobalamin-dependent protein [Candidatus Omnitrophota bacterium]